MHVLFLAGLRLVNEAYYQSFRARLELQQQGGEKLIGVSKKSPLIECP